MALKAGIVGLPNIGKSMLFNALTGSNVPSDNFPFCTIDPNVSTVNVPDARLDRLAALVKPARKVYAATYVMDTAGLVKGASDGQGLGNQFLASIREVDLIIHVVRCFDHANISHATGAVDPLFDKLLIDEELREKDIEMLGRRLKKVSKLGKANPKVYKREEALLTIYIEALEGGKNARDLVVQDGDGPTVYGWELLTTKPVIYIANIDEKSLHSGLPPKLQALADHLAEEEKGALLLPICAAVEAQISALAPKERFPFFQIYGLKEPGLHGLTRAIYDTLGLISYFTVGPQEVRAWPILAGMLAPQAAGTIHTDLCKNFIKAEVIRMEDFFHYKSSAACRLAGKIAIQGKGYVVQDGDVIHFRCR